MEPDLNAAMDKLESTLRQAYESHSPGLDGFLFNGGTIMALLAAGTATALPESMALWARIASGTAAFLIAVTRALDYGGRWRWHVQMRNEYASLMDRLTMVRTVPSADPVQEMRHLYEALATLRTRESSIPGSGAGQQEA